MLIKKQMIKFIRKLCKIFAALMPNRNSFAGNAAGSSIQPIDTTSSRHNASATSPAVLIHQRKLEDRIERYKEIIEGKCKCGELVNKVIGSSCTMWKNGDRYYYPSENTACCIFRCRNCGEVIHKTFVCP